MQTLMTSGSRKRAGSLRRGFLASAIALTSVGSAVAFAVPAGATDPAISQPNHMIVGAGSATTYDMMVRLGTLFNAAPTCDLYQPDTLKTQPLDFTCASIANPTQNGNAGQNSGRYVVAPTVANVQVNPFGDVAVQEPPVGSSTGIKMVNDQGTVPGGHWSGANSNGSYVNVANFINYARSSRNLKNTDYKGLNLVAYAKDGISWSHFTSTGATKTVATPSAQVSDMTQTDIQNVFNGVITNWSGPFHSTDSSGPHNTGGTSAPIIVFSAQVGSGTWDTFSGWVGSDAGGKTYKLSDSSNPVNCYDTQDVTTCQGPAVILENETTSIKVQNLPAALQTPTNSAVKAHFTGLTDVPAAGLVPATESALSSEATTAAAIVAPAVCSKWIWGCTVTKTVNKIPHVNGKVTTYGYTGVFNLNVPSDEVVKADSFFYFSVGKYNYQCGIGTALKSLISTCGGSQPTKYYTYALGNIASVTPSKTNVLGGSSPFPSVRLLYNYYSNGSNSLIPAASPATLNFIGEQGFLCRPQTNTDIDPTTGATYLSEIQAAISAEGFYPLSGGAASGTVNTTALAMGTLTHPASAVTAGTAYAPFTNERMAAFVGAGGTADTGYCLVSSTDGNSSS